MIPGPRSRALADRLRRVESPGVTSFAEDWPVFWESAHGSTVVDVDGNRYTDLTAAFGVASVGHGNPRVAEAVSTQASRLLHGMGDVHPPAIKVALLEAIAEVTPEGLCRAVLGTNGSDAVETALKCADLVTGRPGVLAFEGAYHGLYGGALCVTARRDFRDPFGGRMGGGPTTFFEYPTTPEAADRVLGEMRRKLSGMGSGLPPTGAVIVEPVQGRGGVRVPAPGFIRGLRELCDEHDLLLVADEIFTGLGRTGAWFAIGHEGVTPDLLCIGKALGGGMPLSACAGGAWSLGRWPEPVSGEALHTATFMGHPGSCAAALAALAEIREGGLVERAARLGERAMEALRELPVRDVRGRGLMIGVELDSRERAWAVVTSALREGVLVLPCGDGGRVISITPPLVIEQEALDRALAVLAGCITRLT